MKKFVKLSEVKKNAALKREEMNTAKGGQEYINDPVVKYGTQQQIYSVQN